MIINIFIIHFKLLAATCVIKRLLVCAHHELDHRYLRLSIFLTVRIVLFITLSILPILFVEIFDRNCSVARCIYVMLILLRLHMCVSILYRCDVKFLIHTILFRAKHLAFVSLIIQIILTRDNLTLQAQLVGRRNHCRIFRLVRSVQVAHLRFRFYP